MLTIGQLARYTGVPARTVRFYHSIGLLAEQIDTHRKRVLGLLPTPPVQASNMPLAHIQYAQPAINTGVIDAPAKPNKDLTLTGLYNVLQALREGRALTAKEKQIHSVGLAGVLKTLHDELDAVLAA